MEAFNLLTALLNLTFLHMFFNSSFSTSIRFVINLLFEHQTCPPPHQSTASWKEKSHFVCQKTQPLHRRMLVRRQLLHVTSSVSLLIGKIAWCAAFQGVLRWKERRRFTKLLVMVTILCGFATVAATNAAVAGTRSDQARLVSQRSLRSIWANFCVHNQTWPVAQYRLRPVKSTVRKSFKRKTKETEDKCVGASVEKDSLFVALLGPDVKNRWMLFKCLEAAVKLP